MSKDEYRKNSQKLAGAERPSWDNDRNETINLQQELNVGFTKMTTEGLEFMVSVGGKSEECAQAVLDFRKKKKM